MRTAIGTRRIIDWEHVIAQEKQFGIVTTLGTPICTGCEIREEKKRKKLNHNHVRKGARMRKSLSAAFPLWRWWGYQSKGSTGTCPCTGLAGERKKIVSMKRRD